MGAGAAGYRIHDDALGGRRPGPGQQRGGVLQLVQAVDPDDAELPEGGVDHVVGAGQFAGVGGGGTGPGLGAADLDHDHRNLVAGGVVGGEGEGAAVLESFGVDGDGTGVRLLGEVGDEVGGFEVGLVAGGGPVAEPDAEFLEGVNGAALVA